MGVAFRQLQTPGFIPFHFRKYRFINSIELSVIFGGGDGIPDIILCSVLPDSIVLHRLVNCVIGIENGIYPCKANVCLFCTLQDIHMELEAKIAKFHNRDDAILYASCFDANAGLFEVLAGQQDAIFSDQLNHASIIDGIRLAKTQKYRYKHKGERSIIKI